MKSYISAYIFTMLQFYRPNPSLNFCIKYGMMQQDLKVQKQGKKGAALMRYSDEVIEEVLSIYEVVFVFVGYIHLLK